MTQRRWRRETPMPGRGAAPHRGRGGGARQDMDARVRAIALSLGGREMLYPSLIARPILERVEYPQAFPHLLLSASRGRLPAGADTTAGRNRQRRTAWCLVAWVCYHTYAELADVFLERPIVVTARGTCFRAEVRISHRRVSGRSSFRCAEIVFAGAAAWVERSVESARLAGRCAGARPPSRVQHQRT